MKKIPLTRGKVALVDDEDYKPLLKFKWLATNWRNNSYACHSKWSKQGPMLIPMHRVIMSCPDGFVVDHINGDTLDNRKSNLRICKSRENACNRKKTSSITSSKYKGVTFLKRSRKWQVYIVANKIHYYVGIFSNEEDAARAYDKAALKYHGQFAKLNFN